MEGFGEPFHEIWLELNGYPIYAVTPDAKRTYKSIMRSQTITPATNDKEILWARLLSHVEDVFLKARNYNYAAKHISLFLKTQDFHHHAIDIKLTQATSYPMMIRAELRNGFEKIYKQSFSTNRQNVLYRSTGATIYEFSENTKKQASLFFDNPPLEKKAKQIYPLFDAKKIDFGTSLMDEKRVIKKRKEVKFSLPLISRVE